MKQLIFFKIFIVIVILSRILWVCGYMNEASSPQYIIIQELLTMSQILMFLEWLSLQFNTRRILILAFLLSVGMISITFTFPITINKLKSYEYIALIVGYTVGIFFNSVNNWIVVLRSYALVNIAYFLILYSATLFVLPSGFAWRFAQYYNLTLPNYEQMNTIISIGIILTNFGWLLVLRTEERLHAHFNFASRSEK